MSQLFFGLSPKSLQVGSETFHYVPLRDLKIKGFSLEALPLSIKVLLEAALRQYDGQTITKEHVETLANWQSEAGQGKEVPFKPARIVLQDFTGVPAVVDLAAMRDWVQEQGEDPARINPNVSVDLVIDHSVMVDESGHEGAFAANIKREFERNEERYRFLRWAQEAFDRFRVVPPGTGIVHQVNLEYLATLVREEQGEAGTLLYPDSLIGTDSHTTMIDGLGIVGWGVGGIEAEACMLGQPLYLTMPKVIGVRLEGALPPGSTATDLALRVTELLRKEGVVGKFVEFFGSGVETMTLPDRATIANMAPEYGATMGLFPIDAESLNYLQQTGRSEKLIARVKAYYQAQGMFTEPGCTPPAYSKTLTLDLASVMPSLAGPKRPQDRIDLNAVGQDFQSILRKETAAGGFGVTKKQCEAAVDFEIEGESCRLTHGSVVLAAITSCTNTSNPSVMLGAGLMAKKAAELGLKPPRFVKTSLTPGSQVVTAYLKRANLLESLEQIGFHMVGYGCCTCIGNSGPLSEPVAKAIESQDLTVAAVLSGNRNFEGRIHPQVKASYLASPMLVVAYALAGTMNLDLSCDPLGTDAKGDPVYLKDLWPTADLIAKTMKQALDPKLFREKYADVFTGPAIWRQLKIPQDNLYAWDKESTYIHKPPFFEGWKGEMQDFEPFSDACILALLGDSVTTDHISPAGSIGPDSPAGRYLQKQGVRIKDFNSYGSRRGNHEVMLRGTFANTRIRNRMVPQQEGGYTRVSGEEDVQSIYDAAMSYQKKDVDLVVMAGKEYGTGSSRDWAAKGTALLGVKAVVAESYERIHRSNLIGMGVLPLQFKPGEGYATYGITGEERVSLLECQTPFVPGQEAVLQLRRPDGRKTEVSVIVRLDSQMEIQYFLSGGILHAVLRAMI